MNINRSVFLFISSHRRGWVFSPQDLLSHFLRKEIDNALSDLTLEGKIRRVAKGIYEFPRYSKITKKPRSVDIQKVALCYARKFNWEIQISGESALNLMGLSTQVSSQYTFLCNGASRTYKLYDDTLITFKKIALKHSGYKHPQSSLLIQALLSLKQENITDGVLNEIREYFQENYDEKTPFEKILKDTQYSNAWVYETIKRLANA